MNFQDNGHPKRPPRRDSIRSPVTRIRRPRATFLHQMTKVCPQGDTEAGDRRTTWRPCVALPARALGTPPASRIPDDGQARLVVAFDGGTPSRLGRRHGRPIAHSRRGPRHRRRAVDRAGSPSRQLLDRTSSVGLAPGTRGATALKPDRQKATHFSAELTATAVCVVARLRRQRSHTHATTRFDNLHTRIAGFCLTASVRFYTQGLRL